MKSTILVAIIVLAVGGNTFVAGAASGWNHKALNDEKRASAVVGGFSKSGARNYHDGLVYVRSHGIKVGSKTISDMVELGKLHRKALHRAPVATPSNAASTFSSGSAWAALLVLGVVLVVVFLSGKRRPSSNAGATSVDPSEYEIARTCAIMPISVAGILPHKGEVFYLEASGVDVIAEHHHAEYVGGYAGASVRVMRGFYLRSGSSRGQRVDRTTLDVDDHGILYFSNQRVLFVGARKTVEIPFARLVGVEPFVDGLKINRSNAVPLVARTGSQREAVILQRIVANDLQPPQPAQPTALPSPVVSADQPAARPKLT